MQWYYNLFYSTFSFQPHDFGRDELIVGLKGGQVVDRVYSFTAHGDPYVRSFAHKLLTKITLPWYEMLRTWIYEGRLQDPFQEFFVREAPSESKLSYASYAPNAYPTNAGGGKNSVSSWEGKYVLDENMVPGFIGEGIARKVFLIGKSLNFIRGDCGEEGYVVEHANETSIDGTSNLVLRRCILSIPWWYKGTC